MVPMPEIPCINQKRLWENIMETAKFGSHDDLDGGMHRLSLDMNDKLVRDWFVARATELGCEIRIDKMGNIFAIWWGSSDNSDLAPIGMGSHLDTQPFGGRFDGILGVLAALEVIQTVKESGLRLARPIAAIDWTNEEGARFPAMCSGSSVWAQAKPLSALHDLASLTEPLKTMKSELERIAYLGSTECSYEANPLSGHFELHIEQASHLEETSTQIGIVNGVQGMRWYEVNIHGREGHAGSTPMNVRKDAMVAAAKVILHVEQAARNVKGFGTVGFLKAGSDSTNTIVGDVRLMIDLRHPSDEVLDEVERGFKELLSSLQTETKGMTTTLQRTWENVAVKFDENAIRCVASAAESVVGDSCTIMTSCAGHDSAETAKVVPTAMIFVPSRGGISHNPKEYSTSVQCAEGTQVLLESVLKYDILLSQTSAI